MTTDLPFDRWKQIGFGKSLAWTASDIYGFHIGAQYAHGRHN